MNQLIITAKRKRKVLCAFLLSLIFLPAVHAQQRSVRGVVTDTTGPVEGVTVLVKGSERGVITGANGSYTIRATSADILIFRSIGYLTQEIAVGDRGTIDVLLRRNITSLDQVVVVGYGTQTRRNVTGAVSKVDMKTTENLPNINVTQALRGRVAGVQFTDNGRPGQNGSILIRGPRSLSAGNNPLIILDGIYFNGSITEINPNDIESIEVLKDASAAAIYGSRAANGVILITSKRGTSEKPTIRINSFFGISGWSSRIKLLSPEQYLEKSMEIRRQRGIPFDPDDVSTYLTLTEAQNYQDGKTIDAYDMIDQQGRIMSTDVSISGNTKMTNYYVSASLADEKGIVMNDNLKRIAFRVNLENKITDWLTVGTNTMFSENDQSGVIPSMTQVARQSPFSTWYRVNGSYTQYTVPEDQGVSPNPLWSASLSDNLYIRNNLFTNFYTLIKIPKVKGLTFRVNYANNYRWIRDYNAKRNDINLPGTNTSSASKRNWKASDWVIENILDYKRRLNKDHAIEATLMYGANQDREETTTATAQQLESDVFGWNRLDIGALLTNTSSAQEVSGVSSMARLNYRFKDRYMLTLTARRDGSSVFAANEKYATFPSVAFAWIASDEHFLRGIDPINLLKFRASYGAVGNQAISPYQSLSLASVTRYVFGPESAVGIYPSNISNADLKWETSYTANLAVDFELFNKRIGGTVELYNTATKDLLVERSLPIMTGYTEIWTNLGEINNKGIELTLNTVNIRRGKFEWSTNFVFSHNKNKIVSLYGADANGDGKEDDDIGNGWFIGQPINVYYDYVFDGIYQEGDALPTGYKPGYARFRDLNKDGKVEAANDRTIIGQGSQPKYRWGITNNFSYGNFQLSVFINAMQGWIATFNEIDFFYNSIDPIRPGNMIDAGGWWTEENKSETRPSLEYTRSTLGHSWYLSRNFIRIQDVSLSYDFPQQFLKKNRISNMSLFLSGKNLATFTDWMGTNPESISTERFPIPRSYSIGLKLGF